MVKRRGIILTAIVCLAVSAGIQIPLAWAWAYFWRTSSYAENALLLHRPSHIASNAEHLRVVNNVYTGVRWITVEMWAAGVDTDGMVMRSDESESCDRNPTYPWDPAVVHPAIDDLDCWPTSEAASLNPVTRNGQTVAQLYASGWPFLAAEGRTDWNASTNGWTSTGLRFVTGPMYQQFPNFRQVALCSRPLWPGYLANTTFYATILFLVAMVPSILRMLMRRLRGLCRTCGYDLRGLGAEAPCPECGNGAPRRRTLHART